MSGTLIFLLPFALWLHRQKHTSKNYEPGYELITFAGLKVHGTILASDRLEGRGTSYPGQVKAANYFTGVHADYHQPTDTVDKILFGKMAKIGRLVYVLGWEVANFPRMFARNGAAGGYR